MLIFRKIRHWLVGEKPAVPRLCFIHIPKCAGSSVVGALTALYRREDIQSLPVPLLWKELEATREAWSADDWAREWIVARQCLLAVFLNSGRRLVCGHMPVTRRVVEERSTHYDFFTVLRDPVDRFFSNYIYDRVGPGIRPSVLVPGGSPGEEMDAYLESDAAKWLAREQVVMLSGLPKGRYDRDEAIADARANLESMAVVGFADAMGDLERNLSSLVGVPVRFGRENTTVSHQSESSGPDFAALRSAEREARVRELCADEYELYEWARNTYHPAAR